MTQRKAIFEAIKVAHPDPEYEFDQGAVDAIDNLLDRIGIPRLPASSGGLQPSQRCLELIKEFEGLHRVRSDGLVEAYPDPGSGGDPWTIGYGTTGPDVKRGTVWNKEECERRFAEHVLEFAADVRATIGSAPTEQHEFDALVSLAYNVGMGNLRSSTLLRKHKAGDKAGAAAEFARWNKASGRVMAGLTRRRAAESQLYRGMMK